MMAKLLLLFVFSLLSAVSSLGHAGCDPCICGPGGMYKGDRIEWIKANCGERRKEEIDNQETAFRGTIYTIKHDGSKGFLLAHDFKMDDPTLLMIHTPSFDVKCKVGTFLSSSYQSYQGAQCSIYGADGTHKGWAFNANLFYLQNGYEEVFRGLDGKQYLVRFEQIKN
jgi:hypothetical protein